MTAPGHLTPDEARQLTAMLEALDARLAGLQDRLAAIAEDAGVTLGGKAI